jgi:hypothetical protein
MDSSSMSFARPASLLLAVVTITAVACASGPPANVTALNPRPKAMPTRSMESVTMYAVTVPDGAVEVFLIRVGGDDDLDQADRLNNARWTAARLGCDGLVVREDVPDRQSSIDAQRDHRLETSVSGAVVTRGYVTAVCVSFPERACPSCELPPAR